MDMVLDQKSRIWCNTMVLESRMNQRALVILYQKLRFWYKHQGFLDLEQITSLLLSYINSMMDWIIPSKEI